MIVAVWAAAWAGAPSGLRPMAVDWGAPARWEAWAARDQPARPPKLACDVLIEDHVRLCFRVLQGGQLRWVTNDDLALWGTDVGALRAASVEGAREALNRVESVPVDGLVGSYERMIDGEGWAAAPFLVPERFVARLGVDARFALPAWTVSMVWPAADADFDKALAIGVVEIAREQPGEVSAVVFRWESGAFVPFAEAKAREP